VSEPRYVIDADPVAGRLRVSGDLDITARADLQSAILSAVEGGHDVAVDLGAVTFLDFASGVVLQVLTVAGVLELVERR
jgi:anti-anti-sigma regulatory factor